MSDSDKTTVPANADALPRHTTPTWEVELLISGVAVFAMLQLPGWLDDRWFALRPRLDDTWIQPFQIIYFYTKAATLILAVTFVGHLLLRARWIAQVGMHSVHPDGIRWDSLRLGPVQREVEQRQYGSAEESIDRADNRATTVFAIGVMLASLLLGITVFVLLGVGSALWLSVRFGWNWPVLNVLLTVFALLVLPMFAANRIDRARGHALAPGGTVRRALAAVFAVYGRFGIGRGHNPTLALVASHSGRLRMGLMTAATFLLALAAVGTSYRAQRDPASLGQYDLFPRIDDAAGPVDAAHYADTRNPDRDDAVPYIQSAVVTGPYLKLVVPYQPTADGAALRRTCTAMRSASPGARAVATLDCLQRLHAVALDDRALDPAYAIGSDARTDRPALVSMIDIRALAPGRHVLQVAQAAIGDDKIAAAIASPYRIAFWR
jgi:hypothetical protein